MLQQRVLKSVQRLRGGSFLRNKITMQIVEDDLRDARVLALLNQHLQDMADASPPGSDHTLDVSGLQAPDITFWTVWEDTSLLGCGALKALDADTGELKSMRTEDRHRGKGVGSKILEHIVDVSRKRKYRRLLLETGAAVEFKPAHAFYEKHGFVYCGPFGEYRKDPFSRFMVLEL